MLEFITATVSVAAGLVAAMTGFGIGSLLTPVFALTMDTRLAVAVVAIPHVVGTAVRFRLLRSRIDRKVLLGFGLTSAAGGLAGAALQEIASSRGLNLVFGVLLLSAAFSELTGLGRRMHFHGWLAWAAGALSGLLGGLVGNQGGIRSAALTGFNLPKDTFVGTATAIALFVDGARLPIYLARQHEEMLSQWPAIATATAGVVVGTAIGGRLLRRVPETWFRRLLALALVALGIVMLGRAF